MLTMYTSNKKLAIFCFMLDIQAQNGEYEDYDVDMQCIKKHRELKEANSMKYLTALNTKMQECAKARRNIKMFTEDDFKKQDQVK